MPETKVSIDDVGSVLEGLIHLHKERRDELPVALDKIQGAVGKMDPMLRAAVGRSLIRSAIKEFDPDGSFARLL
jgi:hypothetical protein